jgi:hypothetical protein
MTGNGGTVSHGMGSLFTGIGSTLEITAVDTAALVIGQLSHAITIPSDIATIANHVGSGNWMSAAGATAAAIGHIAIPRYGSFGGAGYGVPTNASLSLIMNSVDAAAQWHDEKGKELGWVKRAWTNPSGLRPPGVFGEAYRILGTIGFGAAGVIYDPEAANKSLIF